MLISHGESIGMSAIQTGLTACKTCLTSYTLSWAPSSSGYFRLWSFFLFVFVFWSCKILLMLYLAWIWYFIGYLFPVWGIFLIFLLLFYSFLVWSSSICLFLLFFLIQWYWIIEDISKFNIMKCSIIIFLTYSMDSSLLLALIHFYFTFCMILEGVLINFCILLFSFPQYYLFFILIFVFWATVNATSGLLLVVWGTNIGCLESAACKVSAISAILSLWLFLGPFKKT